MNSEDIQTEIYRWAVNSNFNAPYGVLTGEHVNNKGRKYKSVTFGRSSSLDCEVQIHNRNFIVVRNNRHGCQSFRNYESVIAYLNTL